MNRGWTPTRWRGGRRRPVPARRGVRWERCVYRHPVDEARVFREESVTGSAGPGAAARSGPRVVRFGGELDLENAGSFGAGLRAGVAGLPRPRLIVDLTDVTFMDGSPLRELCAVEERVVRRGGWVRLVHRHRTIGLLFRASGLLARFPRYATVEDARAGRSAPTAA